MNSNSDVLEYESSAKRLKLEHNETNKMKIIKGSNFSSVTVGPMAVLEGTSADCDSGYDASTLESIPHTSCQQVSPQNLYTDLGENLSTFQTSTDLYQQENSQDSIDADDASTVSSLSDISGLSDLSGQEWKPITGSMMWIQKQMHSGVNPRNILGDLGVDPSQLPSYLDEVTIWKLIINMLAEPPRRNKLRHVNTLDDVVRLLKGAQKVIVLTGAGVSVSCGIPDFRSRDGIYSRLALDFPDLPDPQAMFDIYYFSQDPRPFFKFARDIYPGKFQPSPCHRFIKLLEKQKKLLRNYTQNIDTLEKVADIERVIECHGSFATATCTKCHHKVTADEIRDTVLEQKIPLCGKCHPEGPIAVSGDDIREGGNEKLVSSGIMKPDIVFFGEGLPDTFHRAMNTDKADCDLLLVIGSSLKVRPVALIPSSLPSDVPQILINREPLPHYQFDVELLGDCDVIINHLCHLLGNNWEEGIHERNMLTQAYHLLPQEEESLEMTTDKEVLDNDQETKEKQIEPCCSQCSERGTQCNCKISSVDYPSSNVQIPLEHNTSDNCNNSLLGNNSGQNVGLNTLDSEYIKSIKERHMSIDSTRDSGIGDNSNFTDLETKFDENVDTPTVQSNEAMHSLNSENATEICYENTNMSDMRGFWQPKIKKSLADCLPSNSFYRIPPNRYIFPGAEVFYDPDDSFLHQSSSDDSDSDSTNVDK